MNVDSINKIITNKCGANYRVDFVVSDSADSNSNEVPLYDPTVNYDHVMCLYVNNKCVSTISGKMHPDIHAIELVSKTLPEHEGRKYNVFLRAAFIYCATLMRGIKTVDSYPTNPVSTYTMYKYFNASNPDLDIFIKDKRPTHPGEMVFNVPQATEFHNYFKQKHTLDHAKATQHLDDMINEWFDSLSDEEREELEIDSDEEVPEERRDEFMQYATGFDNKEDAIEDITKNYSKPIILSVDISTAKKKQAIRDKMIQVMTDAVVKCEPRTSRKRKTVASPTRRSLRTK